MSVVDMTWGNTTGVLETDYWVLPPPGSGKSGVRVDNELVGSIGRKASGTLRGTYITEKARATVNWPGLTATELAVIQDAYDNLHDSDDGDKLVLPDGTTIAVVKVIPASFKKNHEYVNNGTVPRYHVSMIFWEV